MIADLQKSLGAASKKTIPAGVVEQAQKDFDTYKAYMQALQFWEQVPGLPDSKVWHFHPLAFIEHFRKCHWLSEKELEAIYVNTPKETRETYRISLNRVMWRIRGDAGMGIAPQRGSDRHRSARAHGFR